MSLHFPSPAEFRQQLRHVLRPKTKLGKVTLWFGYLALLLQVLSAIFHPAPNSLLRGWASFLTFVFGLFAFFLAVRWIRQKLMWRLRNRLIVTYIFIGVIPLILLGSMAYIAGFLFAGQFATYVAMSDLQSALHHLAATNRALTRQFASLAQDGKLNQQLAGEIAGASNESFRHRSVSVWNGDKGFLLTESGVGIKMPLRPSASLGSDFSGFVLDDGRLQLRAMKLLDNGGHQLTVISNMPITPELLHSATRQLGEINLLPPDSETTHPSTAAASQPPGNGNVVIDLGQTRYNYTLKQAEQVSRTVLAGSLPPKANLFDMQIPFGTRFDVVDWSNGKTIPGLMLVDTRPSRIYATLFSTLGEKADIFRDLLVGIAIFLGVIELIALIIGVRLTRSMTKSVAELYTATEHVNRGELTHQIQVRTKDQMAALEQSFNSMTESLAKLIAEQKEKQRLEGELAIAHEVQALLFPADLSGLRSLEVHGVCRPARTVSGDYYDFIPLSESRLVLAVGDISGKGISAALLMATVHAFVRAYSLEPERTLASVPLGAGVSQGDVRTALAPNGDGRGELCPAALMATLNYQLYRSTPAAKYATMFLGCYDAGSRSLTYSNAGHLPPLLLSRDAEVRRLETSGTVVGLFDGVSYDESSVGMHPGDIFIAYSDGVTEPENEFGEFGEERLIELISQHRDQPLARISEIVTTAVTDWIAGGEQPDDITLVLARAR